MADVIRARPHLFQDENTPEKSSHGHQAASPTKMGFAKSAKRAKREDKGTAASREKSAAFFDVSSESPIGGLSETSCA